MQEDDKFKIQELILGINTITRSIDDLRPENQPAKLSLVRKDPTAIYSRGRGIPLNHNKIIRKGMGKMLDAGIITPVYAAWSLPVVIATNNYGATSF